MIHLLSWKNDIVINDAGTKETFPQLFQEKSWDAKLQMGFTVDEVTARGAYTLQLDVTDKAQYMTPQSHRFDFRTDYCLSLYDAETEKAFLKQDIDNVLGEEDIHLFYEYEECSKTMGVYSF